MLALLLALPAFHSPAPAPIQDLAEGERRVEQIPYATCDGSHWRASLSGSQFWHFPRDPDTQPERHEAPVIRYQTWGGGCWQATWDPARRVFNHQPASGGAGHPDTILNFEDWEGVRWTARRDGDDWIVLRP